MKYFISSLILSTHLLYGGDFIVFGDSLSDTGNLARFTHNSGKIYDENFANYLGEDFPSPTGGSRILVDEVINKRPGFMKGPNFAVGGATANVNLGMGNGFFQGGFIKMTGEKEINYFLNDKPQNLQDKKFVYWFGGNDLRLASEKVHEYSSKNNPIINKSIKDVKSQIKTLIDKGAKFIIVPNSPDMAYTPAFFKNFATTVKINGNTLMGKRHWYKKGLPSTFLDNLVDEPVGVKETDVNEVVKESIRKILIAQGESNIDKQTEIWFKQYKAERELVTDLVNYYNDGVTSAINDLKRDDLIIIRPDTNKTLNEIIKHPSYYGFTNITGTAVVQYSDAITNIKKWGSGTGDERAGAFEPEDGKGGLGGIDKPNLWGKGKKFAFSDPVHPSPEMHRMLSDYIITMMETKDGVVEDTSANYNFTFGKYIPFGAEREDLGKTKNLENYRFKSDGTAIYATNKNSIININNFDINSLGRVTSTVLAENGGVINLNNGTVKVTRGTSLTYPFAIRVNGESSQIISNDNFILAVGKNAVGVSVGNKGVFRSINDKILTQGDGLHIWNGTAFLNGTNIVSQDNSAVWIFSNKKKDTSMINFVGSKLDGKNTAIDISPNITKTPVNVTINLNNSIINGNIKTAEKSISDITLRKSKWSMKGNSNVTNLKTRNSEIFFPTGDEMHTLEIKGNYYGGNSIIHMHGNLAGDNSPTDKLVVKGLTSGRTLIDYKNHKGLGDHTKDGIKIIDLYGQGAGCDFKLIKPIYVGPYEYTLISGINKKTGYEDYYLTSSLEKVGNEYFVPAMLMAENKNIQNLKVTKEHEIIYLINPKIIAKALGSYGTIVNSLTNISHFNRNNQINFTLDNNNYKLEDNLYEIKASGTTNRLEYPLWEKGGLYFTVNTGKYKLKDKKRIHYKKNPNIGNIKYSEYGIGIYQGQNLNKNLSLDHILGIKTIKNKYNGIDYLNETNKGYSVVGSELIEYKVKVNKNINIIPQFTLDGVYQELAANKNGVLRYNIGNKFEYNYNKFQINGLFKYYENLKSPKDINIDGINFDSNFNKKGISYSLGGTYSIKNNYKLTLDIIKSEKISSTSYKLGLEYKF